MQQFKSAQTSLNQVPCTSKHISYIKDGILLDYGCGKGRKFKEFVESKGMIYLGYDPYHEEYNNPMVLKCNPDIITCNNVLNVIQEDDIIESIVKELSNYQVKTYFCVYEGNRSGIGKPSKKGCYQRNQKAIEYKPLLEKYFSSVKKKGNIFICN